MLNQTGTKPIREGSNPIYVGGDAGEANELAMAQTRNAFEEAQTQLQRAEELLAKARTDQGADVEAAEQLVADRKKNLEEAKQALEDLSATEQKEELIQ